MSKFGTVICHTSSPLSQLIWFVDNNTNVINGYRLEKFKNTALLQSVLGGEICPSVFGTWVKFDYRGDKIDTQNF